MSGEQVPKRMQWSRMQEKQIGKFLNFYIPIPPYDEQKKIADYITDKVNHIEVEIDKRNKLIKKYQEYKKSLIYEVVTGKKEV